MPRGLSKKTLYLIDAAYAVLAEIQPATVRAVCYRLFTQRLIASMDKAETDMISRMLTTARERELIPWEWIVDETRQVERRPSWEEPEAFIDTVKSAYRKDWWTDQPERVLVVSEKATVGGTLRPVLREYGVGFLVQHGFGSATALNDLAGLSRADSRTLWLLYIGDHDPSGRYMSDRDLPDRIRRYGGAANILRIAVTEEQMEMHTLPTFPAHSKSKDARYRWFRGHHGQICCELDALNPNTLREVVATTIWGLIDPEKWERARTVERAEIASLTDFLATWKGAA